MNKTRFAILFAVLAVAGGYTAWAVADVPPAEQPFLAQAEQIDAAATVTYVGNSWGPVPLYEVDCRQAGLNATFDVNAADADAARAAVVDSIVDAIYQLAGSPPAPATTTAATTTTTDTTTTDGAPAVTTAAAPATTVETPAVTPPVVVVVNPPAATPTTIAAPAPPTTTAPAPVVQTPVQTAPSVSYTVKLTTQAANQPTLTRQLQSALGTKKVKVAATAKLTVNGRPATVAKIRAALAAGHAVKVTIVLRNGVIVVTAVQVK